MKANDETRRTFLLTGAAASLTPLLARADQESHLQHGPYVNLWKWLEGTTWYVPSPNLLAFNYDAATNRIVPLSDQTVYQITGYRLGYFWGRTATQINENTRTFSALFGSVTPEGKILLSFKQYDSITSVPIQGFGSMTRKAGQWTMENQMFSSVPSTNPTSTVGHWAYMVQTEPGSASWNSLPGVNVSVDEFLAGCPEAPSLFNA